ncbi:MAG: flavoprotein [Spirochaetaceae bacterium]
MHSHELPDQVFDSRHPSKDILGTFSSGLKGKKVALGVTGSAAAYKSVDIARLLMRYGAEVYPVMSKAAAKLISPDLLHWACGNSPFVDFSGAVEHVQLGGNVRERADLVLVCPATANTIAKTATGIADTSVTALAGAALGEGVPVCMVPAMHTSLSIDSITDSNIEILKKRGVHFIVSEISEGPAKLPKSETVLWSTIPLLSSNGPLAGKTIVVSAGRTVEYADSLGIIAGGNAAETGWMGVELTKALLLAGAHVYLVYGEGAASPLAGVPAKYVDTAEQMSEEIEKLIAEKNADCFIAAAAVGKWKPSDNSTHSADEQNRSEESFSLDLVPAARVIDRIRKKFPASYIVSFRTLPTNSESAERELAELEEKPVHSRDAFESKADIVALDRIESGMQVFSKQGRRYHIPFSDDFRAAERLVEIISQLVDE